MIHSVYKHEPDAGYMAEDRQGPHHTTIFTGGDDFSYFFDEQTEAQMG